jgi:hypothetical protein
MNVLFFGDCQVKIRDYIPQDLPDVKPSKAERIYISLRIGKNEDPKDSPGIRYGKKNKPGVISWVIDGTRTVTLEMRTGSCKAFVLHGSPRNRRVVLFKYFTPQTIFFSGERNDYP